MSTSLLELAVLISCTPSRSGETTRKTDVFAKIGGEGDRPLIEKAIRDLTGRNLLSELFGGTRLQRRATGDKEVAKTKDKKFKAQVAMRIIAEVPESNSEETISATLVGSCLEILGVENALKMVQDQIQAGYLYVVSHERIRRTENGDAEFKKLGRPFQRKR